MTPSAFAPIARLYQSGQRTLAEAQCRALLTTQPQHAEANHLLGVILLQTGRAAEALQRLDAAVKARSGNLEAQMTLGTALAMNGQTERAQHCFEKVARAQPGNLQALYSLGVSFSYQGRQDEARKTFAKLLAKDSGHVSGWIGQGAALAALGDFEKSIACFVKADALAPGKPEILENLALALLGGRRFAEAEAAARKALAIRPQAKGHAILGHALYILEHFAEAESVLRAALDAAPGDIESKILLASLLRRIGKLDEAYVIFAPLAAEIPAVHLNFSMCLKDMGRLDEALAQADAALDFNQGNADLRFCRAQLLLQAGRLQEGWEEHAARFDSVADPVQRRSFPFPPLSQDDDLSQETILVWPEQGVGDQLTFASALPDLIERAGMVEIVPVIKLAPLFHRSFPQARVFTDLKQTQATRHMPIGDLFPMFRQNIADFPQKPYLVADAEKVLQLRARLNALGPGLKVGIGWRSTSVTLERQKHFFPSLLPWGPILSTPGIVFINLQPKVEQRELNEARQAFGCRIETFDDIDLFDDLDSAAALCSALDLVISNGSANAFLAAAVGAPVWMFYLADSHWDRMGTDHIPWLASLTAVERLWHEPWDNAIGRIAEALKASVAQGRLIAPETRSPLRKW